MNNVKDNERKNKEETIAPATVIVEHNANNRMNARMKRIDRLEEKY